MSKVERQNQNRLTEAQIAELKITVITGEDWEGLYVNGELVRQGYRVTLKDVLEIFGLSLKVVDCDEDWLGARGGLPAKLSEVKPMEGQTL